MNKKLRYYLLEKKYGSLLGGLNILTEGIRLSNLKKDNNEP